VTAVLRLVTDVTPAPQAEQLLLRPVVPFVREGLGAPIEVWFECWRRPKKKRAPAAPVEIKQLDFIVVQRPRTYGECAELVPGPCPFVSCANHLFIDVNPRTGHIKFNFPGKEPWQLLETCASRVVDKYGALSAARVGVFTNRSDAAVLKIERIARKKLAVIGGDD
jgi:hypothetical protein